MLSEGGMDEAVAEKTHLIFKRWIRRGLNFQSRRARSTWACARVQANGEVTQALYAAYLGCDAPCLKSTRVEDLDDKSSQWLSELDAVRPTTRDARQNGHRSGGVKPG